MHNRSKCLNGTKGHAYQIHQQEQKQALDQTTFVLISPINAHTNTHKRNTDQFVCTATIGLIKNKQCQTSAVITALRPPL